MNECLKARLDALSERHRRELARNLGRNSFDAMLADSTVMTLSDGSAWWLTSDQSGGYVAWNFIAINPGQVE
jgi:hypothetical protein